MSEMLPIQRRFLILEQGIGTGLINVVLNGVIALLLFHSVETVPLWGPLSIAGDTLATTFLLPLLLLLVQLLRRLSSLLLLLLLGILQVFYLL